MMEVIAWRTRVAMVEKKEFPVQPRSLLLKKRNITRRAVSLAKKVGQKLVMRCLTTSTKTCHLGPIEQAQRIPKLDSSADQGQNFAWSQDKSCSIPDRKRVVSMTQSSWVVVHIKVIRGG